MTRTKLIRTSNTNAIDPPPDAIYIGGRGGRAHVQCQDGTTLILNVNRGTLVPLRITKLFKTNTTARGVVALYEGRRP